ncbi:MAG: PorV/PorQ family protein [Fidelibacterota bacterium]
MKPAIQLFCIFFISLSGSGLKGQALFQGLNHPVGARGWGMGSSVSSQSKAASGIGANPAVITYVPTLWQINHTVFPLDISASCATAVFSLPVPGKFAIQVHYLDYGSFTERDWDGAETGRFGVYDLTGLLTYGRQITRRLSVGCTAALVQSRLASLSAAAALGRVGLLYYNEVNTLAIGLAYRNFGVLINGYSDDKEEPPAALVLGMSKKLAHLPMILSVDALKTNRNDYSANIGGEFIIGEHLFLRWGNSTRRFQLRGQHSLKSFFAAVSAGLGISYKSLIFDIAVVGLSDAGHITSVSISQHL